MDGFTHVRRRDVEFLTIPAFVRAGGVCCAFSTRVGGVSEAPYNTLNFSRKREQNDASFSENLRRFGDAAGFAHTRAVCINYAHSAALYRATPDDAGRGVTREAVPQVCDGLYTDAPGLPLISFHADCAPLFFYDPVRRAAAVCHAGWRGVAAHIAQNAVRALEGVGCRAGDILAAVGPCISVRYFEVGEDVYDIFVREFGARSVTRRGGRLFADLNHACAADLLAAGIAAAHITDARLCTYGDAEQFFSHRRDRGQTGAMAGVIALK